MSQNTVLRCVDDLGQGLGTQIVCGLHNCKDLSITMDKSCDITDNAQLSVFVRYTNCNLDIAEERLDLRQLILTTGEVIHF